MATPFGKDLISEIFGERPELAFLGFLGQSQAPQSMQQFFRGQVANFLGQYQQALGQQLVQGNLPSLTPEKFFGGLNFQNEFNKFSPQQRGFFPGRLTGSARFLFR